MPAANQLSHQCEAAAWDERGPSSRWWLSGRGIRTWMRHSVPRARDVEWASQAFCVLPLNEGLGLGSRHILPESQSDDI